MVFLHKLAQRLARLKTVLIMGAVATMACEIPLADPSGTVGRLQLSPKTSTLRTGQMAQFVVVALTPTGDTAVMGVRWSTTGGSIVDTSTTGGKHFLQYRSPNQPGQYKVVTQSTVAGLRDSADVIVSAIPVASVSVNPASASVTAGQATQLTATAVDSAGTVLSGRVVTWASSNSGIATVNATGLVTGVAAGSATITATSEGKSGTSAITVTPAPVASVSVSPASGSVAIGQTVPLTATPRDANGNALTGRVVTWGSGNTGVATVSASGLVTGVAVGLAIITATSEGRSGTATITVTALPAPVASVSVSPASTTVTAGQTVQLSATALDAGGNVLLGRVVTWASSNSGLATVSGSGLVTGVAAGTATITATSEGQSGSSTVNVTAAVASVSVSPASASVITGQTVQLTATPRDASGNALTGRVVTWSSSNASRATVNGSGLVTGVSAGSATITATSEGRNGTATVTVTLAPVASVSVTPASPSVVAGQTVQLTATLRDATGNALSGRVVTWASDNTAAATVNGNGLVSGVAAGSATITATSEGISGTSAITVTAPPPPPPGGTWPNEPAGFTLINDFGWNAVNSGGWSSNGGITIVADATAPLSPSSVAEFKYPAGFTSAGVAPGTTYISVGGQRVMYVGYWWKASNPWQGHDSGINKLMFLVSNDFSNDVIMSMRGGVSGPFKLDTYVNGTYLGANVNNPNVALGVWHRIELYVNANTGVVRWWMDGQLLGDRSGVGFASNAFSEFQFSPTWGGAGGTNKQETDYYWYDHVHLSRQ